MTTAPKKQADDRAAGRQAQQRISAHLAAPMLTFDLAAEIEQLHKEASKSNRARLAQASFRAKTQRHAKAQTVGKLNIAQLEKGLSDGWAG